MDIKERFYANLNMIREDWDPVKKKEAEDDEWLSKKLKPSTSGAAKYFKKSSKKNKKKAVTGMDEEAEQLDELSDPTHMSYRAKARNQLNKMVNRLGSKMGSDTVNTKKMKNRAEGIKKSYKLQPKKK